MIEFKKLTYRNFLSTGNAGTSILLNKESTTLIQGNSGAGKSTMIDAICFGLFGRPFRNINKPQLVNSVNGKQCEVQVEFDVGAKSYKIVRGIKPAKFDIFCDDKLISQDAATKDYQKVLEQQILMMTFKTFTQIVILGSTAYTPFMQLPAGARREVIDDILDISVFSIMNTLLKQHVQETKDEQTITDSDIKTKKTQAEGIKRLIDVMSTKRDEEIASVNENIKLIVSKIASLESDLEVLQQSNSSLQEKVAPLKNLIESSNSLLEAITSAEIHRDHISMQVSFFNEHDHCPTCAQDIQSEHKKTMIFDLLASFEEVQSKVEESKSIRDDVRTKITEVHSYTEQYHKNQSKIESINSSIQILQDQQIELLEKLNSLTVTTDVEGPKAELKAVARTVVSLLETKKSLAQKRLLQENAATLLRDTGIKTAIIREYLPIINKLLTKYLIDLQMDVEFVLDEQFNETVKSRYRDDFTYGNFSEGEKLRIDISLMMTWRHIAKLKNSASCNLLIIDEVLSGRLDNSNQDIVIDMINNLARDGSNVFVIAHQDSLVDKFRGGIRFEKQGNFSVMM